MRAFLLSRIELKFFSSLSTRYIRCFLLGAIFEEVVYVGLVSNF